MNFSFDMDNDQAAHLSSLDQKERVVVLQPVTMRIPNCHNIYCPSKLMPKRHVPYEEFIVRYAPEPRNIRICFDETYSLDTMIENSVMVTAYNCGLGCWYIVGSA